MKLINESLSPEEMDNSCETIGLLDIYGFEIFERNSFEQLCINYANEKLHQHFVHHTFKIEEKIYREEGIYFDKTEFIDNEPIVKLIETGPCSMLALLEDEIKMPGSADHRLIEKMNKQFLQIKKLGSIYEKDRKDNLGFTIKHYAGNVNYKIDGFLEKAKDEMSANIVSLMQNSTHPFVALMFPSEQIPNTNQNKGKVNHTKRPIRNLKKSVGLQFKEQLDFLLNKFEMSQPHYIKCIKPNDHKKPSYFDPIRVRHQLKYDIFIFIS